MAYPSSVICPNDLSVTSTYTSPHTSHSQIIEQIVEECAQFIENGDSKLALRQHQKTTGHIVAKKPVIEKMKVVEKEARKAWKK